MTILQAKAKLQERWMELTKDGTDEELMKAVGIAEDVMLHFDECLKKDQVNMLTEIQTEIDDVKAVMNNEIIKYDRKNLVEFVNGINQCLVIIERKINTLV